MCARFDISCFAGWLQCLLTVSLSGLLGARRVGGNGVGGNGVGRSMATVAMVDCLVLYRQSLLSTARQPQLVLCPYTSDFIAPDRDWNLRDTGQESLYH